MLRIDIPTLVFLACIVFATQAIALLVHYRGRRPYDGIGWWLAGTILQAFGFLLMLAIRSRTLQALAALANPLAFTGLLFLGIGTKCFLGRRAAPGPYLGAAAVFLCAYFAFIFAYDSLSGRAAVVSTATFFGALDIARNLRTHRQRHFAGSARFLAGIFAFYGIFHALVAAVSAFAPPLGSYGDLLKDPLRIVLFIVPIVCGMLWTAAFIIMQNQRLNAEMEEEKEKLQQAETEIRALLEEKELLLKEVHHRIKNNMSTIASLLSLQAGLSLDRATIGALEEAGNRLRSMTTLYDVLYRTPRYTELSVNDYLPPLIDDILSNFPRTAPLRVIKRVDDFILGVKKLQPLGIIVNELLTNAMKYAFPEPGDDEIEVSATKQDMRVTVVVQDNGKGIPEAMDFEASAGFGVTVVQALAKQLGGSIRIERSRGTRVVLEFPA